MYRAQALRVPLASGTRSIGWQNQDSLASTFGVVVVLSGQFILRAFAPFPALAGVRPVLQRLSGF